MELRLFADSEIQFTLIDVTNLSSAGKELLLSVSDEEVDPEDVENIFEIDVKRGEIFTVKVDY